MSEHKHEWHLDGTGKYYFCIRGCGEELGITELLINNNELEAELALYKDVEKRAIELLAEAYMQLDEMPIDWEGLRDKYKEDYRQKARATLYNIKENKNEN